MRRQRGVALIIALLALVLAVLIAAAMIDRGETSVARWRNGLRAEQSWQLLRGMEAWAAQGLLEDQRRSRVDSLDEAWARAMPPVEIPGAKLQGRLRDLGGCFNLNSLAPAGIADEVARQRFERLLRGLQLPVELAAQASDWIDRDNVAQPGGAEDAHYAALPPVSFTANTEMVTAGEMRRLPAFTPAHWTVLQPLLCALPADQRINLNTAPAELWLTLDDRISLAMAKRLMRAEGRAYPDVPAVQAALAREGLPPISLEGYDVRSDYFMAEAQIDADGIVFSYRSLLQRLPHSVRVLARARGGALQAVRIEP